MKNEQQAISYKQKNVIPREATRRRGIQRLARATGALLTTLDSALHFVPAERLIKRQKDKDFNGSKVLKAYSL